METRLLTRLGTLRQVEIFMKVAENLSITRAAEELHLSHSAVSVQVAKLADALGLPLHEVHGKQLRLTDAGHQVVQTGHELFAAIRRLDDNLADLKGLSAGSLRISVVTTAKYFLPRILGPFCRDYPAIEVSFKVGNRAQIIDRLNNSEDDLYIFNDPPSHLPLATYRFLPNPLAVIASKNNPLSRRRKLRWEDLAGQTLLMREQGSGTASAIRSHLTAKQLQVVKTMVIESNEAIKYSVIENMGITILSAYVLANASEDGLVQLPVAGFPILSDWYVVHPQQRRLPLIAERFLEFVLKRGPHVLPMENIERQVREALARN